jgi:hypothetical protein
MGSMGKKLTYIQQLRAINDAVYNTQLTTSERRFYKWISTQDRHRHVFQHYIKGQWNTLLKIDQKHKR